ncbi:MAG: hypothetical protein FWC61_01285 [Proteobacteria bacterium]|nr:hypothetical protein [Pseudomonadota bacterium]
MLTFAGTSFWILFGGRKNKTNIVRVPEYKNLQKTLKINYNHQPDYEMPQQQLLKNADRVLELLNNENQAKR